MKIENAFLETIQHLWYHEEVLIFREKLTISKEDEEDCLPWLETAFNEMALHYPGKKPEFNGEAALWGAKLLYYSAHFIVNRQNTLKDLPSLFKEFSSPVTPSAILSADLFLKYLPVVCNQLKGIDPDDELLMFLEDKILSEWILSSVEYLQVLKEEESKQLELILGNTCLKGVFVNRIIESKHTHWVKHPKVFALIDQSLGMFKEEEWASLGWEANKKEKNIDVE